ncbi:hypothetical protein COV20_04685 [Candidatus Woesearchaeota archaeon CG10_big_fil_rev_8_21_14_0_10_45_16]|nr:MAG: hypothetical protein COV20_04685 [Candidatus Woesearchaeota archaeon CG10_big_fil_rev_8_21_14_0_10_45_16]
MRFGEVFSKSWKEYTSNWQFFAVIVLALVFIPNIIVSLVAIPVSLQLSNIGQDLSEIFAILFSPMSMLVAIVGLISILLSIWASASMIYYSLSKKKNMSVKEALDGGRKYFWKYLGYNIVQGFFVIMLFIAFIIPGIIFSVFWVFGPFILIGENKRILESLGESYRLVSGRWWKVLGWGLLFILMVIGVSFVVAMISFIITSLSSLMWASLISPAAMMVTTNIVSKTITLLTQFVVGPMSVLFLKNFYLDLKKN